LILYEIKTNIENIDFLFNLDTPGNILKYLYLLDELKFNISKIDLSIISLLIEKYKNIKDPDLLGFISLLIEKYYNNLSLARTSNFNNYYTNKKKILNLIHNMKIFNLDKKNILISISSILKNEEK